MTAARQAQARNNGGQPTGEILDRGRVGTAELQPGFLNGIVGFGHEGVRMGRPVVHFEIIGKDPAELRNYFSELFGWEFDTSSRHRPVLTLERFQALE